MNRIAVLIMLCFSFGLFLGSCQKECEKGKACCSADALASDTVSLLRHAVYFKFSDSTSLEVVEELHQSFLDLKESIPAILSMEYGINDSPEDLHQGLTHCYLLTFASEQDRDSVYTPHPQHQKFVSSLDGHIDHVMVLDYWAEGVH